MKTPALVKLMLGVLVVLTLHTADAGADQTLAADGNGFATVTLDGTASFDPDGEIVSYVWTLDDLVTRHQSA